MIRNQFCQNLPALLTVALGVAQPCLSAPIRQAVGWRGDGTGIYPDAQPPVTWSATSNVIWKTPLPKKSNASPMLVGDRIFVCSEPDTLLCVAAKDGAILWSSSTTYLDAVPEGQREQARAQQARANELPKTSEETGYATPTPTSDGQRVYVAFGSGLVACYDLEGHRQWVRRLPTHPATYSEPRLYGVPESPLLAGGQLLVHFLKLTALDPASGKTNWEGEAGIHFASPVWVRVGDTEAVLTACGDVFRISDGKPLAAKIWPSEGLPLETCCSPVVQSNTVYLVGKGGGAARLTLSNDGGFATEKLWESKAIRGWCVASPVHADGLLYTLQKGGRFMVLDASTGKSVYVEMLSIKGDNYPSLVLAGPYLYASNNAGETVVLKPGREFQEVARNTLEPFHASLVFSGTRLYVRGQTNLYCIGAK